MASKWEVIEDDDLIKTFDTMEEALKFGQRWDDLNKALGLHGIQVIVSEVEANDD